MQSRRLRRSYRHVPNAGGFIAMETGYLALQFGLFALALGLIYRDAD